MMVYKMAGDYLMGAGPPSKASAKATAHAAAAAVHGTTFCWDFGIIDYDLNLTLSSTLSCLTQSQHPSGLH